MKNFDKWNKAKKKINSRNRAKVKLGEIFWCNLGVNVGVEQDGDEESFHRPIIIIKKYSKQIILAAPITKQIHSGNWYLDIEILGSKQQIILNQIRPIDIRRLTKSIGQISIKEVNQIIDRYMKLIKIQNSPN